MGWDGARTARGAEGCLSQAKRRRSMLGYIPTTGAHSAPAAEQLLLLTEKAQGGQSSCQQCKGEGPLNIKIILNTEPQRQCRLAVRAAASSFQGRRERDSPSQAATDAARQLQPPWLTWACAEHRPHFYCFHTASTALWALSHSYPHHSPALLPLILPLTAWMLLKWGLRCSHLSIGLIFMSSKDW